jgi:hypothetical protein
MVIKLVELYKEWMWRRFEASVVPVGKNVVGSRGLFTTKVGRTEKLSLDKLKLPRREFVNIRAV